MPISILIGLTIPLFITSFVLRARRHRGPATVVLVVGLVMQVILFGIKYGWWSP